MRAFFLLASSIIVALSFSPQTIAFDQKQKIIENEKDQKSLEVWVEDKADGIKVMKMRAEYKAGDKNLITLPCYSHNEPRNLLYLHKKELVAAISCPCNNKSVPAVRIIAEKWNNQSTGEFLEGLQSTSMQTQCIPKDNEGKVSIVWGKWDVWDKLQSTAKDKE